MDINNEISLEESRNKTVSDILDLLKTNNRVACIRYTGYGKSYFVVKQLVDILDENILIVVPSIALIKQYTEMFYGYNNVNIITYQVIKNFDDEYIRYNLGNVKYIICDECHHIGNNKWKNEFDRLVTITEAKVIGLTATPVRGDSVDVVKEYFNGVQVEPIDLFEGISRGYVPKIKYVVAYAKIEDKYNSRFGEVDRYRIKNLLNVPRLLKKYLDDIVNDKNLKILVYVPNIKYIKEAVTQCTQWFKEIYPEKTINIYNIHSDKQYKQNEISLDKFSKNNKNNTIDIMVSVDMLTEGLHLPTIGVGIMLRKTKSPVTYFQQIGRVINNNQPLVFDLINNSEHLYQMKREYTYIDDELSNRFRAPKLMFSECIQLFDEAKEVLDILYKYRSTVRISDDIKAQIIKESDLTFKEIATKYNICVNAVFNIFKEYGIYRKSGVSQAERREKLDDVYRKHKDVIIKNNGTVPREETAKLLGITPQDVLKIMQLNDIPPKRVWKPIDIDREKAEILILLKNNNIKKSDIQKQLGLSEIEYKAYLRNSEISSRIIKKSEYDTEKIKDWILANGKDKTNREIADELNVPISVIWGINRYHKLPHKDERKNTVMTPELEAEIIKSYKELGSLYSVYKKTGIHKNTIKRVVVAHGLKINKPNRK